MLTAWDLWLFWTHVKDFDSCDQLWCLVTKPQNLNNFQRMLLLSWELVKKKELYHLCWILQVLVQWSFDSEGSLLLDCVRVVFATPKDCCYLMVSHIQRFFKLSFWQDRCWENFARSLLMALPENKNHLIFHAFAKTLLTKFLESLENKEHFSCACWFRRGHVKITRVVFVANALLHISRIEC